jgi:nucleoside-diphosphate-sugar epimerase
MRAGRVSTEQDPPDPDSVVAARVAGERACLDFADRGVRASVVRLAPTVHGPDDYVFIPALIAAARRAGVSAYIGDGAYRWPAILLDFADPDGNRWVLQERGFPRE